MKILQINSVCGVGSTGRIATDLYKVLENHGHECKIAYGRGNAPESIKSIRIGSRIDNYLHVLNTRVLDKHGFSSIKATKNFIKEIETYDPDIIHLHNIHGYYINIEILFEYLSKCKKKIIWTLHDCWAFTGHCAYFDYVDCSKWKTGCNKCIQKKTYPKSNWVDKSHVNYEIKKKLFTSVENMTIITPSEWLATLVKQSFLSKYPVKVINNGIDLSKFKYTRNNFKKNYSIIDKTLILGVSSDWSERKGLKYFIELSKILDDEYKIVLVGINKKLKTSIPKNIITIERTDNIEELSEIYSAADIFINPTLEDNFPTTNLESLSCGTPVITFKTGGSVESVNNECGFIVEKRDIKEIKNIIIKLKNEQRSFHEACTQRAKKYYDKESAYIKYINIYEGERK